MEVKQENSIYQVNTTYESPISEVKAEKENAICEMEANSKQGNAIQAAKNEGIKESADEMKKKRRLEKNREMAKNCRRRKKEHKEAVLQEVRLREASEE